ncbi:unnamed protein product [Phytomonas sp. EM1]|nr:unnamed protein product [Phytomonas sp. EM1]|eukprot:CCW65827.1 unnamed protein product [Phytomonas sp. isolate EM1]
MRIIIISDEKEIKETVSFKIGLLKGKGISLLNCTGLEFGKMSLIQKRNTVQNAVFFSRTDPSQKIQLIKLLREQMFVCVMTSHRVNASSSLKCA